MIVTIKTGYKDVVKELLIDNDLMDLMDSFNGKMEFQAPNLVVVNYESEELYRTISLWGADALGCGLIYGFDVER